MSGAHLLWRIGLAVTLALALSPSSAETAEAPAAKLLRMSPKPDLKAEMTRYGLKGYVYSNGTDTIKGLHYAPQVRGSNRLPMIIYFPGSGEIGDPIRQFRIRTLFDLVTSPEFQRRHPCHLLALSPPETAGTLLGGLPGQPTRLQQLTHDFVKALVRLRSLAIDGDRLYVTGYSYGGSGAYALATHYPGEFAAVLPIAGLPPGLEYLDKSHPGNWWHFYNEGDSVGQHVILKGLRCFSEATNAAGGDFRIGSYPEEAHDAWTKAWRDETVWDWMFSKSLKPRKPSTKAELLNLAGSICTASVPGADLSSGPERVTDGLDATGYRPSLDFTRKDWWMVRFPYPIAGKVELVSGDRQGKARLVRGIAEVSTDGTSWERAGSFSAQTGRCTFTRKARFSYLRVRPSADRIPPFLLRRLKVEK